MLPMIKKNIKKHNIFVTTDLGQIQNRLHKVTLSPIPQNDGFADPGDSKDNEAEDKITSSTLKDPQGKPYAMKIVPLDYYTDEE